MRWSESSFLLMDSVKLQWFHPILPVTICWEMRSTRRRSGEYCQAECWFGDGGCSPDHFLALLLSSVLFPSRILAKSLHWCCLELFGLAEGFGVARFPVLWKRLWISWGLVDGILVLFPDCIPDVRAGLSSCFTMVCFLFTK